MRRNEEGGNNQQKPESVMTMVMVVIVMVMVMMRSKGVTVCFVRK